MKRLAQVLFICIGGLSAAEIRTAPIEQAGSERMIVCEAEEFRPGGAGWKPKKYGENYYAATFADTFLSRKAFLGAPEQCEPARASYRVQIRSTGRYLALVRYEAAYRF